MDNNHLQRVAARVSDQMSAILENFKPGAKITVLVRRPGVEDGRQDFLLTNDTLDEAIAALEIRNNPATPSLLADVVSGSVISP